MHAPAAIQELSETHTLGAGTEYRVVRASAEDNRPWIRGAPVCGTLKTHRICHAGIMTAQAPTGSCGCIRAGFISSPA